MIGENISTVSMRGRCFFTKQTKFFSKKKDISLSEIFHKENRNFIVKKNLRRMVEF